MSNPSKAKSASSDASPSARATRRSRIRVGAILILVVAGAVGVISQTAPVKRLASLKVTDNPLIVPPSAQSNPNGQAIPEQYASGGLTPRKLPEKASVRKGGPADVSHLIEGSELIVRGLTKSVTDGIDNGIPFTEVTIQVKDALRGEFGKEYTFRQFGLMAPRKVNGKMFLAATPEGWAKYAVGEDVLLFLYPRASKTGLRTTAGLGQGKIKIEAGNARSQLNNDKLFDGVQVDASLGEAENRLVASEGGPVNSEALISFVRRAVNEKWIERKVMRNAKK